MTWLLIGVLLVLAGGLLRHWLKSDSVALVLQEESGSFLLIAAFVMQVLGSFLFVGAGAYLLYRAIG